jgi:hypothetical protein
MGWRLLHNKAAEGNGTSDGKPPETPAVADPSEGFRAALKKHGDDSTSLARDSWIRAQESARQVTELQGKLPKAGAVILSDEDAAEWAEFRKLGKAKELSEKLGTLGTMEATIASHDREKLIGQASKANGSTGPLGYDPEVLARLIGTDTVVKVEDGKDRIGKDAKLASVVEMIDDKEVVTPLDKYMEKHFPKFLPSLKSADAKGVTTTTRTATSGLPRTEAVRDLNVSRPLRPGRV